MMNALKNFFFYGYVFTLIIAGIWGAFWGAKLDHEILFSLKIESLQDKTAASLLSQYRFLRIIEFGFGLSVLKFRKEIFRNVVINRGFLSIMLLGVLTRLYSLIIDGIPNPVFYFFAVFELVGVIILYIYSRNMIETM